MEKSTDLEVKYQKLATEYSKVRSQATVLKKAVLDEQAKTTELKDLIKKHEQKIRKHDQEMESLIFRNEQLTKRISVLQQELQHSCSNKKNRANSSSSGGGGGSNKNNIENPLQTDLSVLDEELQKKIFENAQLVSSMADKEFEINELKERNLWLQKKIEHLEKELRDNEKRHIAEIDKLKREKINEAQTITLNNLTDNSDDKNEQQSQEIRYLHDEIERWRTECELLRTKPDTDTKLIEHYEKQLNDLYEKQQLAKSETNTLFAENQALYKRLEQLIIDKKSLQNDLDKSNEELILTTNNYKTQLDAMTEHLAAQNDKITKQCDEIQVLKHKISLKK